MWTGAEFHSCAAFVQRLTPKRVKATIGLVWLHRKQRRHAFWYKMISRYTNVLHRYCSADRSMVLSNAPGRYVITVIILSRESLLQRWQQLRWRRNWGTLRPRLHAGRIHWLNHYTGAAESESLLPLCCLTACPTTPSAGCPRCSESVWAVCQKGFLQVDDYRTFKCIRPSWSW